LIHIVLVRRGNCTFVTKVKVARKKGAHAVIIVDQKSSKLSPKAMEQFIPADDGFGDSVRIPSVVVSEREGQQLIDWSRTTGNQVIVEMAWTIPKKSVALLDVWMSSGSKESQKFLKEFAPRRRDLNENIKFMPHYHIFSMDKIKGGCTDSNFCSEDLCTGTDHKFCAEDPDGDGPVSGKMVIEEDIRQLCIHEVTKVRNVNLDDNSQVHTVVEYAEPYWHYVEQFPEACPMARTTADDEDKHFGRRCSEGLMAKVGIDVDKVKKCVRQNTGSMLKSQRDNVAWSPRAIRLNGMRYMGVVDADLVTRAVCACFTKAPAICKVLMKPVDVTQEIWWKLPEPGGRSVSVGTFIGVLLGVGAIVLMGLFFYKRSLVKNIHTSLREEVMLEVQAQMDSYKQLPS